MKNTDFSKVPVKGASMLGSIGSGKSSNEKTTSNSSNEKTTSNSSNNKAPTKSELARRLESNNESDVNIALSYLSGLAEREFNKLVGKAAKKYEIGVVEESNGERHLIVYDRKKPTKTNYSSTSRYDNSESQSEWAARERNNLVKGLAWDLAGTALKKRRRR